MRSDIYVGYECPYYSDSDDYDQYDSDKDDSVFELPEAFCIYRVIRTTFCALDDVPQDSEKSSENDLSPKGKGEEVFYCYRIVILIGLHRLRKSLAD